MATFMVTMPDGSKYRVGGVSTPEEAYSHASNVAGTPPPAQKAPRNPGTGIGWLDKASSFINEAIIGAPEALYNAGAFVADPISRLIVGNQAVDQAQANRKAFVDSVSRAVSPSPSSSGRLTGRVLGTLPLGGLKVPAAAASAAPRLAPFAMRALQGAMAGAAVRDQGTDANVPAAIGAVTNAVVAPAVSAGLGWLGQTRPMQAVGRAIEPVTSRISNVAGNVMDEAYNAVAPMLGQEPLQPFVAPQLPPPIAAAAPTVADALGQKAQARLSNFRKIGVQNPTTAMVTRDPQAWTFEREAAKNAETGGPLIAQLQSVSDDLDNAARALTTGRAKPLGNEATGKLVQDALDTKRNEMQQITSRLYTQVRDTQGNIPVGPLPTFGEILHSPDMTDNATLDGMRTSIMRRLERLGPNPPTVTQAEELRKFIGNLGDTREPVVRMARGQLISALDDDVTANLGGDAFKAARASAKERFGQFSKTFAGKVADEAVSPEALTKRILGTGVPLSEVRSFKDTLLTGTPDQAARGQAAWNRVGSRTLDDLFEGSRLADGRLSGASLAKNFRKNSDKLRLVLTVDEFKTLGRIIAAAKDSTTAVPYSSVNYSNTASAVGNLFAPPKAAGRHPIREFLKHAAAYFTAGPAGNLAVVGVKAVGDEIAARRAAQAMAEGVGLASSPEATAAMAAQATNAARGTALRKAAVSAGRQWGKNVASQYPGLLPALVNTARARR